MKLEFKRALRYVFLKPLVWCRELRMHEKKKTEPIFIGGILSHTDPKFM